MVLTNSDLIVMNYKQISVRAFIWPRDQAFMTQWDCSFIYLVVYLSSFFTWNSPLTRTRGTSFLFVFIPIYLKQSVYIATLKTENIIFSPNEIKHQNDSAFRACERRKRLRLKTETSLNMQMHGAVDLSCVWMILVVCSVYCHVFAVIQSREAPDRSISEPTCGEKHPVSVSSLGWNIWMLWRPNPCRCIFFCQDRAKNKSVVAHLDQY